MIKTPLDLSSPGRPFGESAKEDMGFFARSLEHLPINGYFYALVSFTSRAKEKLQTTFHKSE